MGRQQRILFSCAGRRVALVECFRRASQQLQQDVTLIGADLSMSAPAMHCLDRVFTVPRVDDPDYVDALLTIVKRQKINMLVPLLDHELPPIAAARDQFEALGCHALIASADMIDTCRDKLATFEFLTANGLDCPRTQTWEDVAEKKRHRFPYFLKPRFGSAAVGNHVIRNREELDFHGQRVKEALVQEMLVGPEYTTDVYCGLDGEPRCAVPRKRLEVRGGEVSKGITVDQPEVIELAKETVRALGGAPGVVTVQCMHHQEQRLCVLEINPRFGGGVPLAIQAGADFPRWLMEECMGRKPRIGKRGFKPDVAMLRYDDAVFVNRATSKLGL
ncbi:MAG: ATP-grasp domain-containing protein [Phycisphaerae bacterium]